MFIKAILLLLPMISQAKIDLSISIDDKNNVEIKYTGANIDVISNKERQSFGIGDEVLKDTAEVYSGKRPDDVFVRSPTPWKDLYRKYKWSQVTRTLKPVGSRILKLRSEPVLISSQEFINNSSLKVIGDITMRDNVLFTVQTMWFVNDELEYNQIITYRVKINTSDDDPLVVRTRWGEDLLAEKGYGMSYDDALFFRTRWGEDLIAKKDYVMGAYKTTEVELIPHQKIVANLTAVRIIADVELTYIASLNGHVAYNYENKYQGHHFYAYNINDLLDAAEIPKQKEFKEVIRIKFYSDAKVVATDVDTVKRLVEVRGTRW